jgi:hypothetical protein
VIPASQINALSAPFADMLEFGGVRLSSEGIRPVGGNLATLIRPDDVQSIVLRYGARSHHPIGQAFFGAVMAAMGWWPLQYLVHTLRHGGPTFRPVIAWLLAFPAYGAYMAATAFVRGHYLEVHTRRGRKKLCFAPKTERKAIRQFLEALTARGYSVSREVDLSE